MNMSDLTQFPTIDDRQTMVPGWKITKVLINEREKGSRLKING